MINSHYVPQIILRNFYVDDKITYCDLENKTIQLRNARSVFSEEGYYPPEIEKELCKKAEYQFANLFHNKLEDARNSVTLSSDDLFILKKYLIVSAIRYKSELTEDEKKLVEMLGPEFKIDYDRSLNEILACTKIEDVFDILQHLYDHIWKMFKDGMDGAQELNLHLWSEMKDIIHSYIIFVSTRGEESFVIPDVGRGVYQGPIAMQKAFVLLDYIAQTRDSQALRLMQLISPRDYAIYPLSKNLAIVTMDSFYKLFTKSEFHVNIKLPKEYPTLSSVLNFGSSDVITPPRVKVTGRKKEYKYEIQHLSSQDVSHFNCLMMAEAKRYIACECIKKVQRSIKMVGEYSDKDFSFMNV